MVNIFIIHGAYGNPKENWFFWLKERLQNKNNNVFVPNFPTPNNQTLVNWSNVFDKYKEYLNKKAIFVAHSLGPAFVLNILENNKAKACFFISGFVGKLGIEKFDKINKSFTEKKFKWEKINKNCKDFTVIHSDNDPYVSIEKSKTLAKKLNTETIVIKDGGHFNEDSGYKKFPFLLKKIKQKL